MRELGAPVAFERGEDSPMMCPKVGEPVCPIHRSILLPESDRALSRRQDTRRPRQRHRARRRAVDMEGRDMAARGDEAWRAARIGTERKDDQPRRAMKTERGRHPFGRRPRLSRFSLFVDAPVSRGPVCAVLR